MATPTQLQFDPTLACRHEQICQAMYEWQQRRLQTLCEWLVPEPAQARGLLGAIFIEVWRQPQDIWMAAGAECVARALAEHFRPLFAGPREMAPAAAGTKTPGRRLDPHSSEAIRHAVLELPLPWRLLYLLHDLERYPASTLADWLEMNPRQCGAMIHQARLHLRHRLAQAA